MDWYQNIIETAEGITQLLQRVRRIAILGIKPKDHASKPAFYVPEYLQRVGFEIVPVPVYYPDVEEILGIRVYRKLVDIPGSIDLVNVFRRSEDLPQHVDGILAKHPAAVWFQLGIRNDSVAQALAEAGIQVVQDRCLMSEHIRRLRG